MNFALRAFFWMRLPLSALSPAAAFSLTWLCASWSAGTPRLRQHVRKDRPVYMLHARLAPFPRLPFTTVCASLFHCLQSLRSKCFALPGTLRLFFTKSALLSELLVSGLLRALLRFGFVHLRVKRLHLMDHRNLSPHDLGLFSSLNCPTSASSALHLPVHVHGDVDLCADKLHHVNPHCLWMVWAVGTCLCDTTGTPITLSMY